MHILVLMSDFNHRKICGRDKTAGHKQPRVFLEYNDDNFLTQVVEKPTRENTTVDLTY